MPSLLTKYRNLLLVLLLGAFLSLAWLFPAAAGRLGLAFLLLSVSIAGFVIFHGQRVLYLQGRIDRRALLRNVLLEMAGAGLAMVLAGALARVIVELATRQMNEGLAKFGVGMGLGLLTGVAVGSLARQIRLRYAAIFSPE